MAKSEQRTFEQNNVQVTVEMAVGSYEEELYYADATRVPEGRQEIVMGIAGVKYKDRKEDTWQPLDVDISDIKHECNELRERCEQQEKELTQLRRSLSLLTGGKETDADDSTDTE